MAGQPLLVDAETLRAIYDHISWKTNPDRLGFTRGGKLDLSSPNIVGHLPPRRGGTGGESPIPDPFVYLTDDDGAYLTDDDGAYLIEYSDEPPVVPSTIVIEEEDGSPSIAATKLILPNGTVSVVGTEATYTPDAPATSPNRAYFAYLSALLDPGCVEPPYSGTFSRPVGPTETIYLLGSFDLDIGGTGNRMDLRHSQVPMALRDVTVAGRSSGSLATFLDPALATDADPEATYWARRLQIDQLQTRTVAATGQTASVVHATLLPGPYGIIITRMSMMDLTWLGVGVPNDSELGDDPSTDAMRWDSAHLVPMRVGTMSEMALGYKESGGVGIATAAYVILPAGWSKVPDPVSASYTWDDDFMDASLDTGVWTRAQSTAGNVEIDTRFAWLKLLGNGSGGANALRKTTGFARAGGARLVVDVYPGLSDGSKPTMYVGWGDGTGLGNGALMHAVQFGNSGGDEHLYIIDQGGVTDLGANTYTMGGVYRLRITLTGGGATYEIQGGPEYEPIGGASWDTLTPTTNTAPASTAYPMASAQAAVTSYIGWPRVY